MSADYKIGDFVRSTNKIYFPLGIGRIQKIRNNQCKVQFDPTVFSKPPYRSENKILLLDELEKIYSPLEKLEKEYLDDSWKQFEELVNVSQTRHQRMTELYEEGKQAKEKADQFHQNFIQKATIYRKHRKDYRDARTQLRKKYPLLRKYQKERRQKTRTFRQAKQEQMVQEKAEEIKEKFKKGKVALSFEEMRMILDSEIIDLKQDKKTNDE